MCHPKAKPVVFSHPKTGVALVYLELFFNLLSVLFLSAEIAFHQHFDHHLFFLLFLLAAGLLSVYFVRFLITGSETLLLISHCVLQLCLLEVLIPWSTGQTWPSIFVSGEQAG